MQAMEKEKKGEPHLFLLPALEEESVDDCLTFCSKAKCKRGKRTHKVPDYKLL